MNYENAMEIITSVLQANKSKYTAEVDEACSIMQKMFTEKIKEPSNSEKPNNPIRYIVLEVQKDSYTVCHGIFNDFYKAVGKCVCLIGDSEDSWLENDYKITDRSDMWRTETENGFGWYRKYVCENPEIVIEETWLVIDGGIEESTTYDL